MLGWSRWLVAIVLIGVAGCSGSALPGSPKVYIVNARHDPSGPGSGLWRPGMVDAGAARTALRNYLATAHPDKKDPFSKYEEANRLAISRAFDSYSIQTEGVRVPTGRYFYDSEGNGPKAIYKWAMPHDREGSERSGREIRILMSDGGNCAFTATYDVTTNKITMFMPGGN